TRPRGLLRRRAQATPEAPPAGGAVPAVPVAGTPIPAVPVAGEPVADEPRHATPATSDTETGPGEHGDSEPEIPAYEVPKTVAPAPEGSEFAEPGADVPAQA